MVFKPSEAFTKWWVDNGGPNMDGSLYGLTPHDLAQAAWDAAHKDADQEIATTFVNSYLPCKVRSTIEESAKDDTGRPDPTS